MLLLLLLCFVFCSLLCQQPVSLGFLPHLHQCRILKVSAGTAEGCSAAGREAAGLEACKARRFAIAAGPTCRQAAVL